MCPLFVAPPGQDMWCRRTGNRQHRRHPCPDNHERTNHGKSLSDDSKKQTCPAGRPEIAKQSPAHPTAISRAISAGKRRFSAFPDPSCVISLPSKRYLRVVELFETEKNYVKILDTLLGILRHIPTDTGHPSDFFRHTDLVNEINTTFSQLPDLLKIHKKIVAELDCAIRNWTEDASIGAIFTKYAPDLEAYVPFVNSFEKIAVFLAEWEAKCTRFQAYLRYCQLQPASGRQHLHDLLIRPVQRVPSVVSLLRDIKNKTDDSNPDSLELDKAIAEVQRVLTFINEQKREAEVQELIHDIDGRPINPLAAYGSYICHIQCLELADDQFDERSSILTMILFRDSVEICKQRHVSSRRYSQLTEPKQWEHVEFLPLNRIKELFDVQDGPNCSQAFALSLLSTEDEECRFQFVAIGEFQYQKSAFLRQVASQIMATFPSSQQDTVLRRTPSGDMKIRTSSALARMKPGLRRSLFMALQKLKRVFLNFLCFPSKTSRSRTFQDSRLLSKQSLGSFDRDIAVC